MFRSREIGSSAALAIRMVVSIIDYFAATDSCLNVADAISQPEMRRRPALNVKTVRQLDVVARSVGGIILAPSEMAMAHRRRMRAARRYPRVSLPKGSTAWLWRWRGEELAPATISAMA